MKSVSFYGLTPSSTAFMPNDVRERRGPAATDTRIVIELNGWSLSAPRICWAPSY